MTVVRLLLVIVALSMAIAFVKISIIGMIVAGLIFRTKETVGLLLLGSLIALFSVQPLIGLSAVGVTITLAVILNKREGRLAGALDDPDQE